MTGFQNFSLVSAFIATTLYLVYYFLKPNFDFGDSLNSVPNWGQTYLHNINPPIHYPGFDNPTDDDYSKYGAYLNIALTILGEIASRLEDKLRDDLESKAEEEDNSRRRRRRNVDSEQENIRSTNDEKIRDDLETKAEAEDNIRRNRKRTIDSLQDNIRKSVEEWVRLELERRNAGLDSDIAKDIAARQD